MNRKIVGVLLLLFGISVLLFPFLPLIRYEVRSRIFSQRQAVDRNKYIKKTQNSTSPDPNTNQTFSLRRIVIPKIGVDVDIVEGQTEDAMLKGAWRYSKSSIPPSGGNVVLYGHRWRYLPPNNTTFYLINKLAPGDKIFVFWDGVEYDYTVRENKVVNPEALYVLDQNGQNILTLISCTPLFIADKRLVVTADFQGKIE